MNKEYIKSVESKVNQIFKLARKAQTTSGKAVWFNLHGHVDMIEVRIAESKSLYQNLIFDEKTYTDNMLGDTHSQLDKMISTLQGIINGN